MTTIERVRVGGQHIRVAIHGEGLPLLLINGIGGNIEMWRPLIDALPGRQVIAFDTPGTGSSATPLVPRPMFFIAQTVSALVRRLGYDRVDVLGLSWGGAVAQSLAITDPHLVRRLVLCATVPGFPSVPGTPSAIALMLTRRRYTDPEYLVRIAPTLYGGDIDRRGGLVLEQAVARAGRPPTRWGYMSQLFAMATFTSWPVMHVIRAPTLVMAGDDDPIVPLLNARILACGIPGARLHVVESGGHLFLHERPDEVAPVIDAFLA